MPFCAPEGQRNNGFSGTRTNVKIKFNNDEMFRENYVVESTMQSIACWASRSDHRNRAHSACSLSAEFSVFLKGSFKHYKLFYFVLFFSPSGSIGSLYFS